MSTRSNPLTSGFAAFVFRAILVLTTLGRIRASDAADLKSAMTVTGGEEAAEGHELNVRAFGAKGNDVDDDTNAIRRAIAAAHGRTVYFPAGIYRITKSLTAGVKTGQIRLNGSGAAKFSHGILNFSFNNVHDYSVRSLTLASTGSGYSIIHAIGTSIVGGSDIGEDGPEHRLKYFGNLLCIGENSPIALNVSPQDCVIENSGFALFRNFGLLVRGGITSRFSNLSFQDCGWDLPGSLIGSNPATYCAGCAIKIVANNIPGDYRTVKPQYRPTTMMFDSIFVNVRKDTGMRQTGMRALQCNGGIGFNFVNFQAYSGVLLVRTQAALSGLYIENYDYNGLADGDRRPLCLTTVGCAISSDEPYLANVSVRNAPAELAVPGDGPSAYNSVSETDGIGIRTDGVIRAGRSETIYAGQGDRMVQYELVPWALRDREAFTGTVYVTLVSRSAPEDYATAEFAVHRHTAGGRVIVAPARCLASYASEQSGCAIMGLTLNQTGGVTLKVKWNSGHSAAWVANVGIVGAGGVFP